MSVFGCYSIQGNIRAKSEINQRPRRYSSHRHMHQLLFSPCKVLYVALIQKATWGWRHREFNVKNQRKNLNKLANKRSSSLLLTPTASPSKWPTVSVSWSTYTEWLRLIGSAWCDLKQGNRESVLNPNNKEFSTAPFSSHWSVVNTQCCPAGTGRRGVCFLWRSFTDSSMRELFWGWCGAVHVNHTHTNSDVFFKIFSLQ